MDFGDTKLTPLTNVESFEKRVVFGMFQHSVRQTESYVFVKLSETNGKRLVYEIIGMSS